MNKALRTAVVSTMMVVWTALWMPDEGAAEPRKGQRAGAAFPTQGSPSKGRVNPEEAARNYFSDLEVVTQDGGRVRFFSDVLKGYVVVISFVHTQCKNACPLITQKLTLVRDLLDGQLGQPLQFVSISLNPAQDTPAAMKAFAKRHEADHEGWVFLTGPLDHINQIIRKLGQYTEDLDDHSTIILAGNVDRAHWTKIPPNAMPDAIAAKVRELMANGSPVSKG